MLSRAALFNRRLIQTTGVRYYAKDIKFGADGRRKMLKGVETIYAAVSTTLGPKGRNVIIQQSFGDPRVTKDGVSVAKAIDLKDNFENLGAQLIKSVASRTNSSAGDGTTTATTLAYAIFTEGCKKVAAGMNPMSLKRGIDAATTHVVEQLRTMAKPITTTEEIEQVATVSANDDKVIGKLIAQAMERVGREGVIDVQTGTSLEHEVEVKEGIQFSQGFLSRFFITNPKTQECVLEDCDVLLFDSTIKSLDQLLPALNLVMTERRKLLIVAEGVDQEPLTVLTYNKLSGGAQVVAVKAPEFGENRKTTLQDMAVLTGGTLISEEMGLKLEDVTAEHLGRAKQVRVTSNETMILDGQGSPEAIQERCELVREAIERETSDYQREKLTMRLAKLSTGIAVIRVGGASEVEVNEVKDRVDDAVNATRAAVAEGIVPGGGTALLRASASLDSLDLDNFDENIGVAIVQAACRKPTKTIASNAGVEGDVVVGKVLENADANFGYNAQTEVYEDLIAAGVVDPVKVVRTALVDASSISGLLTTTEAMICDEPQDDAAGPPAPRMPAGMGGMGGMGGGMGF